MEIKELSEVRRMKTPQKKLNMARNTMYSSASKYLHLKSIGKFLPFYLRFQLNSVLCLLTNEGKQFLEMNFPEKQTHCNFHNAFSVHWNSSQFEGDSHYFQQFEIKPSASIPPFQASLPSFRGLPQKEITIIYVENRFLLFGSHQ